MVSVIIPTYNRCEYLKKMIDSILKMEQVETEIIIVDDNSQDDTSSEVEKYISIHPNIRYFRNEKNKGCGFSRKQGLSLTRGEFVVFADDDDYYTDFMFYAKGVTVLSENPGISLVSANTSIKNTKEGSETNEPLKYNGLHDGNEVLSSFMVNYPKPNSTFSTIFRKKSLIDAGVMEMEMVNDAPIYMRALTVGDFYFLNDFVGVYRLHSGSISFNLTAQFIVDNLDEKKAIARRCDFLPKDWLSHQFKITSYYFLYKNNISIVDFLKIMIWGGENHCVKLHEIVRTGLSLVKQRIVN